VKKLALTAVAATGVVLLWAALPYSPGIRVYRDAEILDALRGDDAEIVTIVVGTCEGDPRVRLQEEVGTEVRLLVESRRLYLAGGQKECLDSVPVELEAPLGSRRIIDLRTGKPVTPR
jgi:hypothetical protein